MWAYVKTEAEKCHFIVAESSAQEEAGKDVISLCIRGGEICLIYFRILFTAF
jgi:hypothetical protein